MINKQTSIKNANLRVNQPSDFKGYSVLGGVVSPKASTYSIMGMSNPLAEKPTNVIDQTLPSLRNIGSVATFDNFNPYNTRLPVTRKVVANNMSFLRKNSTKRYSVSVNTLQPVGSPILQRR